MALRTPLSLEKDALIERWLRYIPSDRPSRVRLPELGKPTATARGRANLGAGVSEYRRRVVSIKYFYKMAGDGYRKLHAHIRYVERPGAGEQAVTPQMFGKTQGAVEAHEKVTEWASDRHHWRVVLAPNDGDRLNMVRYTRDVMDEIERSLGTKLDWVAGVHEKPDATHARNQHAHIVIRGI